MRPARRAVLWVALGLSALEPAVPIAPVLAGDASEAAPAGGAPAAPLAQPAEARLLAALRSKIPIDAAAISEDPYLKWGSQSPPRAPPGTVCGVRFGPDQVHYRLATFASAQEARTAGFAVTHYDACGTCSTLQDLAVYLGRPDLTTPVRWCGIRADAAASLRCLESLGFSNACAQTWRYNVQNTRHQCWGVCLWSWISGEAPTRADGRLNTCLQCDEDRSGPIFKAIAGRTRRNSGIHSSIPRPDEEIAPVVHDYVPDLAPK